MSTNVHRSPLTFEFVARQLARPGAHFKVKPLFSFERG